MKKNKDFIFAEEYEESLMIFIEGEMFAFRKLAVVFYKGNTYFVAALYDDGYPISSDKLWLIRVEFRNGKHPLMKVEYDGDKLAGALKKYKKLCQKDSNGQFEKRKIVDKPQSYLFKVGKYLDSCNVPNGTKRLFSHGIQGCHHIKSLHIPKSVTQIDHTAFDNLCDLEYIFVDEKNPEYASDENGILYTKDGTVLSRCPLGKKGMLTISKEINSVAPGAFDGCENLTSVVFPKSLKNLDNGAFKDCTSLESVFLPYGLENLGYNFESDDENSVFSDLYDRDYNFTGVFDNCEKLSSLIIPSTVRTIGYECFYGTGRLKNIKIPASVEKIGFNAFGKCLDLESIEVESDNKNYSSDDGILFDKEKKKLIRCPCCYSKKINIPQTVELLGDKSFENCRFIKSLTIPEFVQVIGISAFSNCTSLESVTLPKNLIKLEMFAFYQCEKLESVVVPGVDMLDEQAFSKCCNLKSIYLSDGVKSICDEAFKDCVNLTEVRLPDSLLEISENAFLGCPNLKFVISDGVCYIGNEANSYLLLLKVMNLNSKHIKINPGTKFIGKEAFKDSFQLVDIEIPDGVVIIRKATFSSCLMLSKIVIPSSVKVIDYCAFYCCKKLSVIFYKGSKEEWDRIFVVDGNERLKQALVLFYSETAPEDGGYYWHYIDGIPYAW